MHPLFSFDAACVEDAVTPWIALSRHYPGVDIKYFRIDPIRGEFICLLRMQPGMSLPAHRHTGAVTVYTLQGTWKYVEYDWIAQPGSVVYETAGSQHTPQTLPDTGTVLTFNIVSGELLFLDAQEQVAGIENWQTATRRYLKFCASNGMQPLDLTGRGKPFSNTVNQPT